VNTTSFAQANHARDSHDAAPPRPTSRAEHRLSPGSRLRPSAVPVVETLEVGASTSPLEREADQVAERVTGTTQPAVNDAAATAAPRVVRDVVQQNGAPLDDATREHFEPRFGQDLAGVRLHTGDTAAASARSIQARAYTAGDHIALGEVPTRELLAHELAHVVQDRERGEARAVHRRVEMRDVGRGEQSGFARLPELIDRLNAVANGLVFSVDENSDLRYTENPYGTMTGFERQMKGFIDSGTPIRLRITNKSGLLPDDAGKFTKTVDVDDYESGYVDIDDLLGSDDLALQTLLVHFLTERAHTKDYSRRIGSEFSQAEFDAGHAAGIDAETKVLQDFFKDPSIRFADEPATATGLRRLWTNSRKDSIRVPFRRSGGVEAWSIQVRLQDGRTMTATEYRDFLDAQAAKAAPAKPAP
jgi:uncharacterized protein DUF4157